MITTREIESVKLSPTKKDFYQMWNEIIDLAIELSPIWKPDNTTESDPGIVLMKLLVAAADKLNYNIDKNILEAFLPSASQEESVRKLCELVGYTPKYFISATTDVVISFIETDENLSLESDFPGGIYFPKYVNLKDEDDLINYVTLEEFTLSPLEPARVIPCIEGVLVDCETNNDNVISSTYLDDNNRYLLPESNIAENGIFVTNISDGAESDLWEKVNVLSAQALGSKVFKVGYDSIRLTPYIQFPEDIDQLIEDGLRIKYIRTNGVNGNITAKRLAKIELPALWSTADTDDPVRKLTTANFSAVNSAAANNGAEKESINDAYNNFKKTIGTFDTLVTCRDYMNKIYMETFSKTNTTPLVSNINVTDIRDDINNALTLCSFNEYGICYKNVCRKDIDKDKTTLTHFDLILYPFKTIYGVGDEKEYVNSFKPTTENGYLIEKKIADTKCLAHNIKYVGASDIAAIKVYSKLHAKIVTTKKVTAIEERDILNRIYKAIYENFNMRKLDFGEKIPEETIKNVVKNASPMIKDIDWMSPELVTKFVLGDAKADEIVLTSQSQDSNNKDEIYNNLVLRNVLAGRIAAFQYDETALNDFEYTKYESSTIEDTYGKKIIPDSQSTLNIYQLKSEFKLPLEAIEKGEDMENGGKPVHQDGYTLKDNEVIQFRTRNLKTTKTFPAYVNYYLELGTNGEEIPAVPATFRTLKDFLDSNKDADQTYWEYLASQSSYYDWFTTLNPQPTNVEEFNKAVQTYSKLFAKKSSTCEVVTEFDESIDNYGYLDLRGKYAAIYNFIKGLEFTYMSSSSAEVTESYQGIFKALNPSASLIKGKLIDRNWVKYINCSEYQTPISSTSMFENHFVQLVHGEDHFDDDLDERYSGNGLGVDGVQTGIYKNADYELKGNDKLFINYTTSSEENGVTTEQAVNKVYQSTADERIIIRPNFKLVDSKTYHDSHSYQKKNGFNFDNVNLEGMFTLGPNEQIEIREPIKVELNSKITNIYWERLDDEEQETYSSIEFKFTEGNGDEYTLKDGEYFFYTDDKKLDLAYYGAGTTIKRNANTPGLFKKPSEDTSATIEDILTYGDIGAINWVQVNLYSSGDSNSRALTLYENQYITLTEGDCILKVTSDGDWSELTNTFSPVNVANTSYKFASDQVERTLPMNNVEGIKWEVRSRLNFCLGPTISQKLNKYDSIEIDYQEQYYDQDGKYHTRDKDHITLKPENDDHGKCRPLYINSNYNCIYATDIKSVLVKGFDENGLLDEHLNDFGIWTYGYDPIEDINNQNIAFDNYSGKYTKYTFAQLTPPHRETGEAFSINVRIPSKSLFGALMINYKPVDIIDSSKSEHEAYIKATGGEIYPFNVITNYSSGYSGSDFDGNTITLKEGINVIWIGKPTSKITFYADTNYSSILVFSHVKSVVGINPKLDYRSTDQEDVLNQLLQDIRATEYADQFYYSVDVENDNKIDLNPLVSSQNMSAPETWFDANNINNKFVINEIDAEYLKTGITLTNSSRR